MTESKLLHSTIVDLNLLNDCFLGETDLQIQIISTFLEQSSEKMTLIKNGILEKNHQQIQENTHFLKSSFSSLGINLYKEFSELEDLAREKEDIKQISNLFEKCIPQYELSYKEYERLLEQLQ